MSDLDIMRELIKAQSTRLIEIANNIHDIEKFNRLYNSIQYLKYRVDLEERHSA